MKKKGILVFIIILLGIFLIKTFIVDTDDLIFENKSTSEIQELKIKVVTTEEKKEFVLDTNIAAESTVSYNLDKYLPSEDGVLEVNITTKNETGTLDNEVLKQVYFTNGRLIKKLEITYP